MESEVQRFSDWYISDYVNVHQDEAFSLTHILRHWRDNIGGDEVSLILLVDCLPLTFWELLDAAFSRVGFHRHSVEYRFSPLPTDTQHSKPVLLAGNWQKSTTSYPKLLSERIATDWPCKTGLYLPNLKSLDELASPDKGAMVLLNLLTADETLHSDLEASGSSHDEELHRLFSRLARSVKSLQERWGGQPERFGIYVITDHGATMIQDHEQTNLDSVVVKDLFQDSKRRYAKLSSSDAQKVPDNLWKLGYKFTRQPFCEEDAVYFIPRGHNTVRTGKRGRTYSHGGASPEEVIVPCSMFKAVKAEWAEPASRFIDLAIDRDAKMATFYIRRLTRLRVELQNPNSESIAVSRVEVLSPSTDVKTCTTPMIGAKGTGMIDCDLYFAKSATSEDTLILQLFYEIAGEERVHEMRLAARFKSASSGGFTLKDI